MPKYVPRYLKESLAEPAREVREPASELGVEVMVKSEGSSDALPESSEFVDELMRRLQREIPAKTAGSKGRRAGGADAAGLGELPGIRAGDGIPGELKPADDWMPWKRDADPSVGDPSPGGGDGGDPAGAAEISANLDGDDNHVGLDDKSSIGVSQNSPNPDRPELPGNSRAHQRQLHDMHDNALGPRSRGSGGPSSGGRADSRGSGGSSSSGQARGIIIGLVVATLFWWLVAFLFVWRNAPTIRFMMLLHEAWRRRDRNFCRDFVP